MERMTRVNAVPKTLECRVRLTHGQQRQFPIGEALLIKPACDTSACPHCLTEVVAHLFRSGRRIPRGSIYPVVRRICAKSRTDLGEQSRRICSASHTRIVSAPSYDS